MQVKISSHTNAQQKLKQVLKHGLGGTQHNEISFGYSTFGPDAFLIKRFSLRGTGQDR
jgi:hypothetical protein